MLQYLLPGSFVVAFGLMALLDSFLLSAWRRSAGEHWTKRARILYPARMSVRWNTWLIPLLLLGVAMHLSLELSDGLLAFAVALVGGSSGTWFFTKETLPRARFRTWLRDFLLNLSTGAPRGALYAGIAFSMPPRLNGHAFALLAIPVAYDLFLALGGLQRLYRAVGIIYDAPERVQKLAAEVSARMHGPAPKVWAAASTISNAYALFWTRAILITEPAMESLDDAQLKGVLAHEVAHLTEGLGVRLLRTGSLLGFWPILLFKPLTELYGEGVLLALGVWMWLVRRQVLSLSRRMEHRADRSAVEQSPAESAAYAGALAKLYELNGVPAVLPAGRRMHPDLYDRLLAAGVTPDFPRPAPPRRFQFQTACLAFVTAVLLGPVLFNLLDDFKNERAPRKTNPAAQQR